MGMNFGRSRGPSSSRSPGLSALALSFFFFFAYWNTQRTRSFSASLPCHYVSDSRANSPHSESRMIFRVFHSLSVRNCSNGLFSGRWWPGVRVSSSRTRQFWIVFGFWFLTSSHLVVRRKSTRADPHERFSIVTCNSFQPSRRRIKW